MDGTFWDNRNSGVVNVTFNVSATWQLGAFGTLIRSASNSSNNWQNGYQAGIATIPATSNWILRKTNALNPSITTIGAFYGNLTIENNTGAAWSAPPLPSTFQGFTGFPTIKGNLDIGGAGTNTLTFINQQTNAQSTLVLGNVIVRAGNVLQNYGTGLETQGNLTNNGTISYDANDGRNLNFTGGNVQSITNTGTLGIFNFTINKTANSLTLNNAITIDNVATFTNGRVFSTATNLLTINTAGSVIGASNSSFVSGPVRYLNLAAFNFPVGKVNSYRPISISATAGGGGIFWTEAFSNGCTANCLATSYIGPNGAWTVTNGSNPGIPNEWFVSCAENGNAATVCGAGCGADPSLHLGSVVGSDCDIFCPGGDCGAAYDACTGCSWNCTGSPAIDKSGIPHHQLYWIFNFNISI